jgi:hypothetical protein
MSGPPGAAGGCDDRPPRVHLISGSLSIAPPFFVSRLLAGLLSRIMVANSHGDDEISASV